jgi:hypothetical protein
MKKKISISEGLGWLKTLTKRHAELIQLRDKSAAKVTQDYQGKTVVTTPMYDAKDLDKKVAVLAREIRLCESAIKDTNSSTELKDYILDDDVLAELT